MQHGTISVKAVPMRYLITFHQLCFSCVEPSPGCCFHCLRRTADDNVREYQLKVVKTRYPLMMSQQS